MSFSLRSLTYPDLLPRAVALAARQLGEPGFPADIWQRERERWSGSHQGGQHPPGHRGGRAFAQAVYGTHPYGLR
jgi:zinc protease